MTTPTRAPPLGLAPSGDGTAWHALSADSVLSAQQVDEREGLSSAEVQARTQRFGPNKFDSGKAEPWWHAFLRQYADPMQVVLLVAALWINFTTLLFQGLGLGLGYGEPASGLMERKPRPPERPILTRGVIIWLAAAGLVMGAGTLGVAS